MLGHAPYGTFFRDMAERVPYAEFLEWFKHSPADWERYRVERNRLEYGGARCADAINGAMDIVRALRKAEGRG